VQQNVPLLARGAGYKFAIVGNLNFCARVLSSCWVIEMPLKGCARLESKAVFPFFSPKALAWEAFKR